MKFFDRLFGREEKRGSLEAHEKVDIDKEYNPFQKREEEKKEKLGIIESDKF